MRHGFLLTLLICFPVTLSLGEDYGPSDCGTCTASNDCLIPVNQKCVPCLKIAGKVLDFTHNHGRDRRIYSPALQCKRDLYVYLPPCYDPSQTYPVMIILHGILQDERMFLEIVLEKLDQAIRDGSLPPMIVAAPDGSFTSDPGAWDSGSFFIDSPRGNYQSWVSRDLWDFLNCNYRIDPNPKAHIMAGVSMGGFGAFSIAIKEPHKFGTAIGIVPALNIRWMDQCENYRAGFDPLNWGWRNAATQPHEVIGVFGPIHVKVKDIIYPAFGKGAGSMLLASDNNPIELIDRTGLKPGQLDMFITMAGKDNFNLDAQAQSFIYLARARGHHIDAMLFPEANHTVGGAIPMMQPAFTWAAKRLKPHAPSVQ